MAIAESPWPDKHTQKGPFRAFYTAKTLLALESRFV